MKFEWDPRKESTNSAKHGVSFSEARTVFYDTTATSFVDPDHSNSEQRFVTVGYSSMAGSWSCITSIAVMRPG